jgi:tetratricopeptide (TPR) repeat protein
VRFLNACIALTCLTFFPIICLAGEPQWVEVRSPNFSVITDAGEKKGRDAALHFEQMRSVFGTLMTKANVNLPVPLQIVAFRNTKEMRQVAPIFNGKPTEVAGLFQGGEDRSFIMLDMSVDNPWSVVFHEYAHRLMNGNLAARTDPWFEEGFAEYFSSIEVDNKEARVGRIPGETYQILQRVGSMRVSDLFRVQQYSSTYNESGDHRTTFYAESALMVHYLYDNGLLPKLQIYFNSLQVDKKPVEQSVQTAFGMTPEQFDKVLRDYLNSGHYRYYPIATPAGIVAAQFTVEPVSAANARALVADIHAHSPDYSGKALAEFQEVLKTDPDNASALRGIGFAYLQQRNFDQAAEYLRRAVQHDSKDPRVHCYYAILLNQAGPSSPEKWAEIEKELEIALALDPHLAEAYSLLGYTQAGSGESEKAIASLKKALELSPRNESYLFNLANAYVADRNVDAAISIFRNLAERGTPPVSTEARDALGRAMNFKSHMNAPVTLMERPKIEVRDEKTGEWREEPAEPPKDSDTHEAVIQLPAGAPMRFLKGKLVTVDCSAPPQAVMTVAAGAKAVKLHVKDSGHVLVIGADQFSCDWKNKSIAVNYRDRADGDGDAVSVEMQ